MTIKKKYFVNNTEFLVLLDEYKETKVLTEKLGKIFVDMTKNLLFSRQFINYSDDWKAEMQSDALFNLCRYAGTFDRTKSSNPFAYFTRTIINAFIMRIKKEKKGNMNIEKIRKQAYDEFLQRENLYIDSQDSGDCESEYDQQ
jgi:hypothetical protein